MSDNSNESHAPEGSGDTSPDGKRSGRRRRRGKRRPDDRPTTDGQNTTSDSSSSEQPTSAQPRAEQPRREQREQRKPRAPREPRPESASSEGGEGDGERRGRNRRRGRGRGGDRPERPETAAGTTDQKAPEGAVAAPAQDSDPKRGDRGDRSERGDRNERGRRGGRNDKEEKKERAPRGSVLQRRSTRGNVDLDAALAKDAVEEAPAPLPIATDVDTYIRNLKGWQREVVTTLRGIVRNQAREAEEAILWSQPVYTLNGPVCYIKAFTDHVNFGFWRGNEIDDPEDLLIGDLPTMRHVTIRHVNEVNREAFEGLVRSAVKLNKEKGDPT